ncbi:hypothetical protein EON64_11820 [archaeon]|nr:MAG: hypothetical protein EON64_11820 [archaeon]
MASPRIKARDTSLTTNRYFTAISSDCDTDCDMCDSDMLMEYGLVGGFDTVVNMMGEQIAVVTGYSIIEDEDHDIDNEENDNKDDNASTSSSSQDGPTLALEGVTYAELQYYSQSLATHLYYRFGIRAQDRVVIVTNNETSAEIVAMLSCMRIGAVFIPLDLSQLSRERLKQILADSSPLAAIVQGADDTDHIVLLLATLGLYRCALVRSGGSLVRFL